MAAEEPPAMVLIAETPNVLAANAVLSLPTVTPLLVGAIVLLPDTSPVSLAARVYPVPALVFTVRVTALETVDSAGSDGSNCKLNDGVSLVKVNDSGISTVTAVEAAPKDTDGLVAVSIAAGVVALSF